MGTRHWLFRSLKKFLDLLNCPLFELYVDYIKVS